MSASEPGDGNRRLGDFPFVFLSYDEPWADANWRELVGNQPHALRVHGVKGLDACHKAAADAVTGDWVVTIDADTRIDPRLLDATVPLYLMNGNLRLDWLSRNAVNGLWSGNGCVKLWPRALLQEMRSHEAAPPGAMSLDHDIGAIPSGQIGTGDDARACGIHRTVADRVSRLPRGSAGNGFPAPDGRSDGAAQWPCRLARGYRSTAPGSRSGAASGGTPRTGTGCSTVPGLACCCHSGRAGIPG